MKKCIVSFADSAGTYRKKLLRLEQSLKGNFDGDFLGFTSYDQIGCEPHSVIPYKFKPYSIQKAIDMGYELILWADSPVYCIKPIQRVFDQIEQDGYLLFDNIGFSLGDFSSDKQLDYFGITRDQAWSIKQVMACVMGFKTSPSTLKWFNEYRDVANNLYKGAWDNDDLTESKDARVRGNRHDQSVISCIAHINNLKITNAQQTHFCYLEHKKVLPITVSMYSSG
jgi:hypothetical protein